MKTKLTLIILICGLWTMDYRLATAQNIGVDVATPLEKLDVLGGIRIGNTGTNNAGTIRWNTPNFQGYNGTTWINFNAVGGITTLNGLTGATQTFANGTAGTAPAFSPAGTVHTLNIPFAATNGVTGGILSNTQYTAFLNGLLPSATSGQTLRHNGTNWIANSLLYNDGTNVGIGITAPGAKLDITGTNAGTTSLQLRSGNDNNSFSSNQIIFAHNGNELQRHAIKTRHRSGGEVGNAIDFYVWKYGIDAGGTIGTQHVMTIAGDNGGSVGIGNTSPASMFSIGASNQFQVNSAGAIAAATGITSSGTINFSGLSANGIVRTTGGTGTLSSSGGVINLASEVTGTLPIVNGGTNIATIGAAGSVTFSNGTQHASTAVGTLGQVLTSQAAGTPTWTTPTTGTVTGVTATSPVVSSGGAAPVISLNGLTTLGAANQIIGSNNAANALEYKTVTAGTAVSVVHAANAITINNTGVTSWGGGSTGLTPAAATTGAVTLAGTLIVGNGGTGATTFTANGVLYGQTASALLVTPASTVAGQFLQTTTIGSAPTWLTTLGIANGGTGSTTQNWVDLTTNQTAAGNKTWSGSTATFNGYTYLGGINSQARPATGTHAAVNWNFSGGSREMTFWNTDPTAGATDVAFRFRQLTSATTDNLLMTMMANGAIFGKFRHITYHNYNIPSGWYNPGASGSTWFPAAGAEGEDDANGVTAPWQGRGQNMLAPYSGRLSKVILRTDNGSSNPGTEIRGRICISVNGGTPTRTGSMIDLNENQQSTINITSGTAGFSFNAGDILNVGVDVGDSQGGCPGGDCYAEDNDYFVTLVWEYDIQD